MECNICGSTEFIDVRNRKNAMCANCKSYERTRLLFLYIKKYVAIDANSRVLHMAPERGLYDYFRGVCGENYTAVDLNPKIYGDLEVQPFDLCKDVFDLERNHYNLILHNHVLEHLPCNESAVLIRLTNSLKDDGLQLFSVPILSGHYEADIAPRSLAERERRFGQDDHVRRFGKEDIQRSLGMLFQIPDTYDLLAEFEADELRRYNIPESKWQGYSSDSVLKLRKANLRI